MVSGGTEVNQFKAVLKKTKMFMFLCFLFVIKLYVRINIYCYFISKTYFSVVDGNLGVHVAPK